MRSVICTFDLAGGPIPPLHDRHVVWLRSFFALAVGWRGLDTARSTVFGPVLSPSFSHQAQAIGTSDTCTTSSFVCVCVCYIPSLPPVCVDHVVLDVDLFSCGFQLTCCWWWFHRCPSSFITLAHALWTTAGCRRFRFRLLDLS